MGKQWQGKRLGRDEKKRVTVGYCGIFRGFQRFFWGLLPIFFWEFLWFSSFFSFFCQAFGLFQGLPDILGRDILVFFERSFGIPLAMPRFFSDLFLVLGLFFANPTAHTIDSP